MAAWNSAMARVRDASTMEQPYVRVLAYHRIGHERLDPVCVQPCVFREQARIIRDEWRALDETTFVQYLEGRERLSPKSVLLTFDDGDASILEHALPALTELKLPAVVFIVPEFVGQARRSKRGTRAFMTWNDLRCLIEAGVSIGSHGLTHVSLPGLSTKEVKYEAEASKKRIENKLGVEVAGFAYPYGTRRDYNETVAWVLQSAGYRYAFTARSGVVRAGEIRYALPRSKIESDAGMGMFRSIMRGRLDTWRVVDDFLWPIQTSARG